MIVYFLRYTCYVDYGFCVVLLTWNRVFLIASVFLVLCFISWLHSVNLWMFFNNLPHVAWYVRCQICCKIYIVYYCYHRCFLNFMFIKCLFIYCITICVVWYFKYWLWNPSTVYYISEKLVLILFFSTRFIVIF